MLKLIKFFGNNNAYLLLLLYCGIAWMLIRFEKSDPVNNLQARSTELRAAFSQSLSDLGHYFSLKEENEKLALQNSSLLGQIIHKNNMLRDSADIKHLDEFVENRPVRLISARVVDRRFDTRENILIINAGRNQGIKKDMAVLTPDGLVGRVVLVSDNFAKVMPVIHSEFGVSVFSDSNNTHGVLRWNGKEEQTAQMHYVPVSSPILTGETVHTTDFSTFAFRGITVGQIVEITPNKQFYRINVRLGVNFSTLSHVLVAEKTTDPEKVEIIKDNPAEGENSPQESNP